MAFHVVGAVAIKVRPDSTGFKEEAKAQLQKEANGLEVEIDLKPEDISVEEIKGEVAKANARLKASRTRIKVPVVTEDEGDRGHLARVNKIKNEFKEMQRVADASPIDVKFNLGLRVREMARQLKEDKRKLQAVADAEKIELDTIAKLDRQGIMRAAQNLGRDISQQLTPDIEKSFDQLRGEKLLLEPNIAIKKDRLQENLKELEHLSLLQMSVDPKINTPEVRRRWAELKRQIEADQVDLRIDLDRQKAIGRLLAPIEVDEDSVNDEFSKILKNFKGVVHPRAEMDFDQLRKQRVDLNADVRFDSDRIQRNLDEMSRLKRRMLSVDPEINTADVRARWAELKKQLESDTVRLRGNLEEIDKIDAILAPVVVDGDAISRDMRNIMRNVRSTIHPDVELDRAQLRDLDVELDAGINIKKEQIQRKLAELSRLQQLVLSVDPEVNTEEARRQWDHLKRELEGDTVDLKADLDRQGRVRAQLAELTRNRNIDLLVRINARSLATAKATLAALSGLNVFQRAGNLVERIATNLDNYALKIGKIGTIVGNLSNVLGSGTASLITFGAQLGQLGGFVLAAPAGLLALAAAGVAGAMAFQGFGDAIKGDEAALASLPENARKAAKALQGTWSEIQVPAQRSFWEGMGDSLTVFVEATLPQIKRGMIEVSGAMGRMASEGLQGLTEFARQGKFGDLLNNLATGLRNAAPAAFSLSDAFVTIGDAGAKFFPKIGTYIEEMAGRFDRWIRSAEQSGKITEWMENAVSTASTLKNSIKNIAGIFGGIADSARRAGAGGIEAFADQMERIRGIVEGPVWQGTMTTLFEGARQGAKALYAALGPVGDTLVSMAPALKGIFISVGETLGGLLSNIASAMQSPLFQGGLTDLFTGIQSGMEGLGKHLPGIVDGLGSLGSILGSVFESVLPAVGRGFEIISGAFVTMQPSLQAVGKSLGGIANDALSALAGILPVVTGPLTLVLDLFTSLPQPVQSAMAAFLLFKPVASAMVGVLGNIAAKAGVMTGFTAAMSGLGGALATGGIALLLVGIADAMKKTGDEAQYAQDAIRRYSDVAQGIHQGKVDNPFNQLGNPQTQQAALDGVDQFIEKYKAYTGKALDRGSLTDLMLGVDSPSARAARAELENTLRTADQLGGSEGFRNALGIGSIFSPMNIGLRDMAGVSANARSEIQGFLGTADEVSKLDWTQWLDQAGRTEAVTALAGASLEEFGRITSKNAPVIKRSIDGSRKDLKGFSSEAEIMALALGGTADEVNVNSMQLASALKIYGDTPRGIARAMTELGFSTKDIDTAMKSLGVSAEDAGEAAKYGWGSVAEATGNLTSQLAKDTPLLYAGSDGISEISRALSDTTGINADFLANTLRSTGLNAEAMAQGLSNAGVPASTIKQVLTELGVPAEQAASAMDRVAVAGQQVGDGWSSFKAQEFAEALKEISSAGGDAASQADALRDAIDRLNGGTLSSERQVAALNRALVQAQSAFTLTDSQIADMGPSWTGWGNAIDDTTGQINTASKAGQDLFAAVDALGGEALRTANDAFKKTYESTGDLAKASDAARASISGQVESFRQAAKAVGLNDAEITNLLDRYNLLPDEIVTEVSTNAVDADTDLKGIVGMMSQIKPGVTANIGLANADAIQKLKDLNVDVHQLADGTWDITLSADPAQAKAQVDGFVSYASTKTATVSIDAARDRAQRGLDQFLRIANEAVARGTLDVDTTKGEDKVKGLLGWIDGLISFITTGNDTGPAEGAATALGNWVSSIWAWINTDNNVGPAQQRTGSLLGWIDGLWGNVNTGADTSKAVDSVDRLRDWVQRQGANITIGATVGASVGAAVGSVKSMLGFASANGNIWDGRNRLEKFANGGFSFGRNTFGGPERHSAFITRKLRVFGEPETGGEAYIPLAASKRPRSMQILKKVGDKFGADVIPKMQSKIRQYADGGIEGGGSSPTLAAQRSNVTIIQNYPQVEKDSVGVMRAGQLMSAQGTF